MVQDDVPFSDVLCRLCAYWDYNLEKIASWLNIRNQTLPVLLGCWFAFFNVILGDNVNLRRQHLRERKNESLNLNIWNKCPEKPTLNTWPSHAPSEITINFSPDPWYLTPNSYSAPVNFGKHLKKKPRVGQKLQLHIKFLPPSIMYWSPKIRND